MKTILVINTGSTSTKVAIYRDEEKLLQADLVMPEELLKQSAAAVDQLTFRSKVVADWLAENGYSVDNLDIISARGGTLPPIKGGAYKVNQLMIDVLTYAPVSNHESALACMIGANIAAGTDTLVIIYDGVSVNEMNDIAKYTGCPFIKNNGRGHVLNTRMTSKLVAKKLGIRYEAGAFIVAHLGGSISVMAHEKGKIVDAVNAFSGPMSPQRAGRLPTDELIRLCYSGKYGQRELLKMLNGGSGYMGYFGTQDARRISDMIDAGDTLAREVTCALAYQTAKAVAEMRIAIDAPVDRVIITGGMANFRYVTDFIEKKVSFIAPVEVLPGEFEMDALAKGALDVLHGKELPKEYDVPPVNYASVDEFYAFVRSVRN